MRWIQENIASILAGMGLLLLLALAAAGTIRGRRKGGGCSLGCAACQGCSRAQEQNEGADAKP